uniref:SEA domain-containing protein n=1 Tax=Echeneis naucrates TaxID=173247 RepID=A0A665U520_ECHNA
MLNWTDITASVNFCCLVVASTDRKLDSERVGHLDELMEEQLFHRGHAALTRTKRNILFPSGIKLCTQETFDQAISNHLIYFHLRVCQETVWEAFKIFWDRLPERAEYQDWVSRCMDSSISVMDIGRSFSQSEEHADLIRSEEQADLTVTSEDKTQESDGGEISEVGDITSEEHDGFGEPGTEGMEPDISEIGNEIDDTLLRPPRPLRDQAVELSIKLRGETYNNALRDQSSFHYQQLIEDAFEQLPASLVLFPLRGLVVLVHYAITLEVDAGGISNETLDFISFKNNMVEKNYPGAAEQPTVVYTITDFRNYITEALHKDNFMTNSSLENGTTAEPGETRGQTKVLTLTECNVSSLQHKTLKEILLLINLKSENGLELKSESKDKTGRSSDDVVSIKKCVSRFSVCVPVPVVLGLVDLDPSSKMSHVFIFFTDTGNIEDEGFLLNNAPGAGDDTPRGDHAVSPVGSAVPPPKPLKTQTGTENTLDDGSGSGFSGDGQGADLWSWQPMVTSDRTGFYNVEDGSLDILPPPDLEETDEEDEGQDGEGVVQFPATENDDELATTESPEVSLPTAGVPVSDESLSNGGFEETILGQVLVTPHISTDPRYTTTTHVPVFSSKGTLTVELSVQTVEASASHNEELMEISHDKVNTEILRTTSSSLQEVRDGSSVMDIPMSEHDFSDLPSLDVSFDVFQYGDVATEGDSSGFYSGAQGSDLDAIALPTRPGRALTVFFSLRVTNMAFSMDLFNKSSPEYKALEQRFLQLLVPYLQSNLNNFQNLEILNFRNGSIVVNSRMRFGKPVPKGVTNVVYLILEDFANTAYQTMNLAIDKYSLDVESGDRADPCKFQACNKFSRCMVNRWSSEAECVCDAGYLSVDGLPCQSVCEVQYDFCLNDGKCDIIPGKGAICRWGEESFIFEFIYLLIGENWWYRGEHSGIIFFLARTLREQYDGEDSEDPLRQETATSKSVPNGVEEYHCRRDPGFPEYSSSMSADGAKDLSSDEIQHVYQNTALSKEEIQERLRIIELCSRDQHFADFVRQTQV